VAVRQGEAAPRPDEAHFTVAAAGVTAGGVAAASVAVD
jgi:hypothetical protein